MEKALYELKPILCVVFGLCGVFFCPAIVSPPSLVLTGLGLTIARMRYTYRRQLQRSIKECRVTKRMTR